MPAARLDVDRGHGLHWISSAVQFDFSFTFEDKIDFSHLLMIMGARIFFDMDQVKRGNRARQIGEGPASGAAWAWFARNLVKAGDGEICHEEA